MTGVLIFDGSHKSQTCAWSFFQILSNLADILGPGISAHFHNTIWQSISQLLLVFVLDVFPIIDIKGSEPGQLFNILKQSLAKADVVIRCGFTDLLGYAGGYSLASHWRFINSVDSTFVIIFVFLISHIALVPLDTLHSRNILSLQLGSLLVNLTTLDSCC